MEISGYGKAKIRHILLRELAKEVPRNINLHSYKYLIFDGKYLFGRRYVLLVLMDALTKKPITLTIARSESKVCILPWLLGLKEAGLSPKAVTTDGKQAIIYAFKEVWPDITTQRCLFHIKLQIRAWVRAKPKDESAKELLRLAYTIDNVTNSTEALFFKENYLNLKNKYNDDLKKLDPNHPIQSDLLRAYSVLKYALPNCFNYLNDSNIAKTTSSLEGYFKQIQRIRGFGHNGLTEDHLFQFIYWKAYFDLK